MLRNNKDFTIPEAAFTLGVQEKEVKQLLLDKILTEKIVFGNIMITWESIHDYLVDRLQKTPDGYITIKEAIFFSGLEEEIIHGGIDRKEFFTMKYRRGIAIEIKSFFLWIKFLKKIGMISFTPTPFLNGKITVKNTQGLYDEACFEISSICLKYLHGDTTLKLSKNKTKVNGENFVGLVDLNAQCGDCLFYEVEGILCSHLLFDLKRAFKCFQKCPILEFALSKYDVKAIKRDFELYRKR